MLIADRRITLIVGAGATLSDAATRPLKSRPPLDRGFFKGVKAAGYSELSSILKYMQSNYAINPLNDPDDTLEGILSILYSDVYSPVGGSAAVSAFRSLLRILNRRLAETTNALSPTRRTNLYRILSSYFRDGYKPSQITILTFNQDLQIEKTLHALASKQTWSKIGRILSFPYCYKLPQYEITKPIPGTKVFDIGATDDPGILVLKLHGSLNWVSTHISANPSPKSLLNPKRKLYVTRRMSPRA